MARERPLRVRQSSEASYSSASSISLIEVHCMHINLVPKTIDVLQGDPYGRGMVFVGCYFEVAFQY